MATTAAPRLVPRQDAGLRRLTEGQKVAILARFERLLNAAEGCGSVCVSLHIDDAGRVNRLSGALVEA